MWGEDSSSGVLEGGRGAGQEASPPVSASVWVHLPLPRGGVGMGGLEVRVERMEEAETGRAEGGAMTALFWYDGGETAFRPAREEQ